MKKTKKEVSLSSLEQKLQSLEIGLRESKLESFDWRLHSMDFRVQTMEAKIDTILNLLKGIAYRQDRPGREHAETRRIVDSLPHAHPAP